MCEILAAPAATGFHAQVNPHESAFIYRGEARRMGIYYDLQ
jgi:hypothetical protein